MALLTGAPTGRSGRRVVPGASEHGTAQAPGAVVMIRPHHFRPNPQTAADNAFQVVPGTVSEAGVAAAAYAEVGRAAEQLREAGVAVHLFEDEGTDRPDSVFCNNWFSTHVDGRVAVHAMHAPNRRREPRQDVLAELRRCYRVTEVVDLSAGPTLEGTGAVVLDHDRRTAYCSRSLRADDAALADFCARFGYSQHAFDTADAVGRPIYHTNVMMALGSRLSLVGLGLVGDPGQRRRLRRALAARGDVVELSRTQVGEFAGNAIELSTPAGPVLAMSSRGLASLTQRQRAVIGRSVEILPLDVPTCELAGGSVRCMIAGIHLEAAAGASSVLSG